MVCELRLHLTRQSDVLKHLGHFLDLVCAALHLQLLNHDLLVLPRDRRFVEKAGGKLFGILLQEDISPVQAAEQANYCVKSLIHDIVLNAFESGSKLLVGILGDVDGRKLLLVHKLLERVVPRLLKHHLVSERELHQLVDFCLEVQQLLREKVRIFDISFVHDNLLSSRVDVGIHLVDDESESVLVSAEHIVEQLEFLKVLLFEHVHATGVLVGHSLGHLGNHLLLDNLQHLALGLGLEPVVRVFFLVCKRVLHTCQVLRAIALRIPKLGALKRLFLCL